ncbi:MAG: hypothetical protein K1X89_15825 [Myxococcaceae bacterium]|nr:hypothetical protein [Myxococcaceae bacterium]
MNAGTIVRCLGLCTLAACATVPKGPPRAHFDDFLHGDRIADLPIGPANIAELDEALAKFPKDAIKDQRHRARGLGELELELERDGVVPHFEIRGMYLHWFFQGDRLVAVGWRGDITSYLHDLHMEAVDQGTIHPNTKLFGKLRRVHTLDANWKVSGPTPFVVGQEVALDGTTGAWGTLLRFYDEAAFLKYVADEQVIADAAEAKRQAEWARDQKEIAERLAKARAEREEARRQHPVALLSDAARRLEGKAPMTAAGLWEEALSRAFGLIITGGKPEDVSDADRWRWDAIRGLHRALAPACARALPALDNLGLPTNLTSTWDPEASKALQALPPVWFRCFSDGAFAAGPTARALGVTPIRVSLEPRTLTGLSEQFVRDDKTFVKQVEDKQQNPAREQAMGPVRELAARIRALQAAQNEALAEANLQANDRSNQVFEGTGARRDATGHAYGPAISSFTRKQGGAAMILEGMARNQAAGFDREISQLTGRLQAMLDALPPETVTTTRTETTVERHTRRDWKSQLKQRIVVETKPPLVVNVDTPAFLNVEEGKQLSEQRANELLMGGLGDGLVGPFVQRAFATWATDQVKAGAFKGPPPPGGLSREAAAVEKQWTDYFFARGPRPEASPELAGWVPAVPDGTPRPTDPNLAASWDQPLEADFIQVGNGIVGSKQRIVYPVTLKDFVFELDAEFLGGPTDGTLGFCWRGSGADAWKPSNAYTLGLQWTGNFNVFAIENNRARSIATGNAGSFAYRPTPLIDRRKTHVRIEAQGAHSAISLNGQLLDQVDDASVREGFLCIDTTGSTVRLSNLRIESR